jgi:glycosyltransferase involved in cell wall biosynthesis
MEKHAGCAQERFAPVLRQIWEVTRQIKEQGALSPVAFLRRYETEIRSAFPGSMSQAQEPGRVPVLICARKEVENIGRTLYGLSRSVIRVSPVVVDNGSIDGTGNFASRLGAEVIHEGRPGLLNALRRGFTYFKNIEYKGPILLTDADTIPLPTWAATIVRYAQSTIPTGGEAFGRLFYHDYHGELHIIKNMLLSVGANFLDSRAMKRGEPRFHGANGIIMPDSEGKILQALSQIDAPLPKGYGTDAAVRDTIISIGGLISFCSDNDAFVVTSGRRFPTIKDVTKLALTREKVIERVYKDWVQ